MKLNKKAMAREGEERGRMILVKTVIREAPSIRAASSRSRGMVS